MELANHPLRSLFLDMDSYFASVEQYLRPELRGRPVAVAPMMTESTSCIAASYEAKAYGVKTGTRVFDARQMCPGIAIVPARPPLYIDVHHQIVEIVESCIHVDHVLSIDEMLCWLPLNWRTEDKILEVGQLIKAKLSEAFAQSINCSIGVASNGWLAKMASKMKKPDGCYILKHEDLPEALYELHLKDLHGIGESMESRLHAKGIHTIEQLCAASKERLKDVWGGVGGTLLWSKLRGEEINDIDSNPTKKSIGHGHVLPPELRHPHKAISVVHRLVQKAAFRARSHGMKVGGIDLSISYVNRTKWSRSLEFTETADSLFFTKVIKALWKGRPDQETPIQKANIVLFRLVSEDSYTPSLFEPHKGDNDRLSQAIDTIVHKFGKDALYLGGAHGAMDTAQPKIAFQRIPDLKRER